MGFSGYKYSGYINASIIVIVIMTYLIKYVFQIRHKI